MPDFEEKLVMDNMQIIKGLVRGIMYKLRIPKRDYEDCLQEALLLIYKKAYAYNPEKKFSNFAHSVIKNGLIDVYRRNKENKLEVVYLEATIVSDDEGKNLELMSILGNENDTENKALQNLTIDTIRQYISEAKHNCTAKTTIKGFEALELKIEGYSGVQIAEMFNVPQNSLRSWMSKARKILMSDERFIDLLMEY